MGTVRSEPARAAVRPRRRSLRVAIVVAVQLLLAGAFLLASTAIYALERRALAGEIDDRLADLAADLSELAATGVDPRTGKPFADSESLLYQALRQLSIGSNEGAVGLVNGNVRWVSPTATLRTPLESDADALAQLAPLAAGSTASVRTVATAVADYRVLAVPVSVAGDMSPTLFVFAVDRGERLADLTRRHLNIFGSVALVTMVLTGIAGWIVIGRLLRPLSALEATATRISEADLSPRVPVTSDDQVSHLAEEVNDMLDRLEHGFAAQREMLDAVGHDLRTPITVMRGHVELMDVTDPQDAAATRGVVLDELDRMNRLVGALMLLAQSESIDFVVPAPTELAPLFDEIVDKARALGERRWLVAARTELTGQVDAQRITQAVLQLVDNAVKATEPGDEIRLSLGVSGEHAGYAEFAVSDDGPGIAESDHELVFEQRTRLRSGSDGLGLGLPIVKAIAEAHGGQVTLTSQPGRGARFALLVPLATADDAAPAQEVAWSPS